MSRSLSVSSRNGTSVRTPIVRHASVISDHIRLFHGATAPSSTVRTIPVPNVLRIPGTAGRWLSASDAGTYGISSTFAFDAPVIGGERLQIAP